MMFGSTWKTMPNKHIIQNHFHPGHHAKEIINLQYLHSVLPLHQSQNCKEKLYCYVVHFYFLNSDYSSEAHVAKHVKKKNQAT
jgi:hypothetical protein